MIQKYLNKISIIHLILVSFGIHMFVISQPNYEILDELYFTNFTRWFMVGIDHTPYQLFGLSLIEYPFVSVIGDNWFSWRFPIVVFGMVFLYFYYKVIEHLQNRKIALLTTGILCFSPLIFVHSSLLLRDIPVMALGFIGVYCYLKQRYYFSAFVISCSALIKETAIFFVIFIALHYVMVNQKNITLFVLSGKIIKTPFIVCIILISTFLIPIAIYDNTINVLEYSTSQPEYLVSDRNSELNVIRFNILSTNDILLEIPVENFNYVDKVTNPFHHISLMFSNGYYNQNNIKSNSFLVSFLPIASDTSVYIYQEEKTRTFYDEKERQHHEKIFPFFWAQSLINYSYWHISFYACFALIGYAVLSRLKNSIELSSDAKFIICGIISFFIPFLFINYTRDTFAYYMIYYLPIMAFGLVTIIYKIPSKIRLVVMISFCIAIITNFAVAFPVL